MEIESSVCGFCGLPSCTNKLVQSSKTNKNKFFKIESNCDYFFSYGCKPVYSKCEKCSNHLARYHLTRCEVTKCSNHLARCEVTKCSNHLARCEVTKCSVDVWKFHMSQYYKECHNLVAFPEELKISKQEKMYICIQIMLKIIDFLLYA